MFPRIALQQSKAFNLGEHRIGELLLHTNDRLFRVLKQFIYRISHQE